MESPVHPQRPEMGRRKLPFGRELWIEREDFMESPPKGYFRLYPGNLVRLRYGYVVKCIGADKDPGGKVTAVHCEYLPDSRSGTPGSDKYKVKGNIHWVSVAHAYEAEVRLYDRLFAVENPGTDESKSFLDEINPDSMVRLEGAMMEPYLAGAKPGTRVQFERVGYFCVDRDSKPGKLVWNRTVGLKDSWARLQKKSDNKSEAKPQAKAQAKVTSPKPPSPAKTPAAPPAEIGIDELQRVELRVGIVREAALVPEADKLIRLMVDLGEGRLRQIFTGLRAYYPDPAVLVGRRVAVVANLKPRQMKFGLSEGMILAGGGGDRPHRIVTFDDGDGAPQPGDKIT
jgi:methionine--tRNA ligase beta chain